MASLKKRQPNKLASQKKTSLSNQVQSFLSDVLHISDKKNPTLLIAYSGGLDSSVLLHIVTQLQNQLAFSLSAMHVHHGLSDQADEWATFCQKTCHHYQVPFSTYKVRIDVKSGLGVEATAREARYQALHSQQSDFICLAHHQDDQAETLLLQLARGAGVKGLAGMAKIDVQRRLLRPLLDCSRNDLVAYAKAHQIDWVEDESNADTRYDRNFIRHEVLPLLSKQYNHIATTLSRSAQHLASASEMLDDLAAIDASVVMNKQQQPPSIHLTPLFELTEARQGNLMRWWLAQQNISMPSALLLAQILQQLRGAKADAQIKVKVADQTYVMRYQDQAYLVEEPKVDKPFSLLWQGEEVIVLPDGSRLFFSQKVGLGFAFQRDGRAALIIKNREGGEHFKPDLNRPKRTLKAVLQTCLVPPWQRTRLPLLFVGEQLMVVPNVGVDAHHLAKENELGLQVTWFPN